MPRTISLISRRQFLSGLAAAGVLVVGGLAWYDLTFSSIVFGPAPGPFGPAEFLALSRILTAEADLDPEIGAALLKALESNNIFENHRLARLWAKLQKNPGRGPRSREEREIAQRVLRAWYTGIVETPRGPVLITYFDALMFRVREPVGSTPMTCGGEFGYWVAAPSGGV
jgi:hypothetical protein